MAELFGTYEYRTPDGNTVIVTGVSQKLGTEAYSWSDGKDVGLVTDYIRRHSTGAKAKLLDYPIPWR
jgi:hypothetical protein